MARLQSAVRLPACGNCSIWLRLSTGPDHFDMHMPPLPYVKRIPGRDHDVTEACYSERAVGRFEQGC